MSSNLRKKSTHGRAKRKSCLLYCVGQPCNSVSKSAPIILDQLNKQCCTFPANTVAYNPSNFVSYTTKYNEVCGKCLSIIYIPSARVLIVFYNCVL